MNELYPGQKEIGDRKVCQDRHSVEQRDKGEAVLRSKTNDRQEWASQAPYHFVRLLLFVAPFVYCLCRMSGPCYCFHDVLLVQTRFVV